MSWRRLRGLRVVACAAAPLALGAQGPPSAPPPPPRDPMAVARLAAESTTTAVAEHGDKLTAYYVVPEIPATAVLGVAPASISRPATPKDFASTLIDAIDASGHVRQGIALEASLGLSKAFRVPLAVYQQNRRARFWSKILVSLATARSAGDTSSTDVAWGVRAPLIDDGDPLARPAYTARLGAAMLQCAPREPPPIPRNTGQTAAQLAAERAQIQPLIDAREAEERACLERTADELGKAAADSLWNSTRVMVAYAGSVRLAQSSVDGRHRLADRVWAVGSVPFSRIAGPIPFAKTTQVIGYVNYGRQHAVDTLAGYWSLSSGVRLNVGNATVNGFYEMLGDWRNSAPSGVRKATTAWSGGLEFLATQGVWISAGIGKRAQDALKPDQTVVIANIRWGMSAKPSLGP